MGLQLINKMAEVKLIQAVTELRVRATGWQCIHFHLADLLEEYKSEYQIKIAMNLILDLLKNHEGSLYVLVDSSIIVLCQNLEEHLKNKLTFQLRYLYMDDPLAYTDTGQENPQFCTIYDLKKQWQELYTLCTQRMGVYARKQSIGIQPVVDKPKQEKAEIHLPVIERTDLNNDKATDKRGENAPSTDTGGLSATNLVMIERNLRNIDLQAAIRRQPVCAVLPDMKIRRVFDELYINIAHLRRIMKLEVDFLSNRWLFKYLTQILDSHMIDLIRSKPDGYLNSPISINLNVDTLLSPQFAEFDATIKPATKISIVIEVPVMDVFADMNAFIIAIAEVQKLGYRVCLDGLTTVSFTSINREKLGVDLIKMQWNGALKGDPKSVANTTLMEAVSNTGTNRVILCRCDNRTAVEYGQALGISLFQGRYLDSVLNPTAKLEN